jgi:peptidoglycan hydrolase CwlO-like protein
MTGRVQAEILTQLRKRIEISHKEIKKCEARISELQADILECHRLIDKKL